MAPRAAAAQIGRLAPRQGTFVEALPMDLSPVSRATVTLGPMMGNQAPIESRAEHATSAHAARLRPTRPLVEME